MAVVRTGQVVEQPEFGRYDIGVGSFGVPGGDGSVVVTQGDLFAMTTQGTDLPVAVGGYGAVGLLSVAGAGSRAVATGNAGGGATTRVQIGLDNGGGAGGGKRFAGGRGRRPFPHRGRAGGGRRPGRGCARDRVDIRHRQRADRRRDRADCGVPDHDPVAGQLRRRRHAAPVQRRPGRVERHVFPACRRRSAGADRGRGRAGSLSAAGRSSILAATGRCRSAGLGVRVFPSPPRGT